MTSTTEVQVNGHTGGMADQPEPEVPARARRRTYTAKYKLAVLAEYEQLDREGKGALLRREGLYTSLISEWRKQRDRGALEALSATRGVRRLIPRIGRSHGWLLSGTSLSRSSNAPGGWWRCRETLRALGGTRDREPARRERARQMIDDAIDELTPLVGVGRACEAVGWPRSSYHRRHTRQHGPPAPPASRAGQRQPRALTGDERAEVLKVLHDEQFVDQAPASVYATLLDQGSYLCSISTMYRLLRERGETGDRRAQAAHPPRVKPELIADAPNRVWSWDITKLAGPAKWSWYYLHVIIDIYSRYVPGWLLAPREDAKLAEQLLGDTCFKQGIGHGQLSIHADRGSSMASKTVALLLADLGVTKSHSRPQVSNDNPFSEAQFKTLKYRPDFPDRFDSIEHARAHVRDFFGWYNHQHRHSGVALMCPARRALGPAEQITAARGQVLDAAYAKHPERFVRQPPRPPSLHEAVWINRPDQQEPAQ